MNPELLEAGVPKSYISIKDLALEVAYAELPYLNVCLAAEVNGLPDEADRLAILASEAGIVAGRAYIETMSAELEAGIELRVSEQETNPALLEQSPAPTPESFLNKGELANVELTRIAMATKFEHLGAKPEDFKLVMHEVEDEQGNKSNQITLIYAADKGLDLGNPKKDYDKDRNWNSITDKMNADSFIVEVLGNKLDTRSSTDLALLKALAKSNPKINEWVWRTGEPEMADAMYAPIARLDGGNADGGVSDRGNDYRNIAFRPAVVIAKV